MTNKFSLFFLFLAAFLTTPLFAGTLPDRLDLVYRAKAAGINIGTLNRELRNKGDGIYTVTSETNATGIAAILLNDTYREKSEFRVANGMIYPISYHQAPDKKPEKARIASFDWEKKKVSLNNNRVYDILPGVQDPASFLFFWMLSPPEQAQTGKISLVDGKRMKEFEFQVVGEEQYPSLWGEIRALHIKRQVKGEAKKVLHMWLAMDHNYIPVKLENVRPKYTMTFTLEKADGLDTGER